MTSTEYTDTLRRLTDGPIHFPKPEWSETTNAWIWRVSGYETAKVTEAFEAASMAAFAAAVEAGIDTEEPSFIDALFDKAEKYYCAMRSVYPEAFPASDIQ